MLVLTLMLACPPPMAPETVVDSQSQDTADTQDTSDTGEPVDPGMVWDDTDSLSSTSGVGWYTQLAGDHSGWCSNYPSQDSAEALELQAGGVDEALFQHSAVVLSAKYSSRLGGSAPGLEAVCVELLSQLLATPDFEIPSDTDLPRNINDCPDLFPSEPSKVPAGMEAYYSVEEEGSERLNWASFTNIMAYQWRMTKAMDRTESELSELPGCWMEFRLKGEAAKGDAFQLNRNMMPAILFALETYGTWSVAYTEGALGSMVVSGADYSVPEQVWSFVSGGADPVDSSGFHTGLMLSSYPQDAGFVLNVDRLDVSEGQDYRPGVSPDDVDKMLGWAIIDPDNEVQLRQLDWFITKSLEVGVDLDPSSQDLRFHKSFDAKGPGPRFPEGWPAE